MSTDQATFRVIYQRAVMVSNFHLTQIADMELSELLTHKIKNT